MTKTYFKIRLGYQDEELFVNWDLPHGDFIKTQDKLLARFRSMSDPDLFIEYIIKKSQGRLILRKELQELGIISPNRNLNFTRVLMEQANFNALLRQLFVKQLSPNAIKIVTESQISETELYQLDDYLKKIKHSPSARHKNSTHFRRPDTT